jgi:DNA-binding LacI/PurR family transcriptional regulator
MPTISDIAEKAHVSSALVSRVINNKPGVSQENREKILAVMRECNYLPNSLARSLAMKTTHAIGVVMDDLCDSFFFQLIKGMQDTADAMHYNVLFCSGRSDEAVKKQYVDFLTKGLTDGIIAYGSSKQNEEMFRQLSKRSYSFVLIEGHIPDQKINNVLLDNFKGAYAATEHLIQRGYRHICHFSGDMNRKVSFDRLDGFVKAMNDHMIPIEQPGILYTDFSEKSGYEQMKKLIESGGELPEAIFFGADKPAYGAIQAMYEAHLKTPDDIALIGFDDDRPDTYPIVYPALSTVRQPLYDMGAESVRLLVKAIKNPGMPCEVKMFSPELILRDTCK